MEMQAAIAALKLLAKKQSEPITLYTDSEYLIKGTQWVKGKRKAGKQPKVNLYSTKIFGNSRSF